MSYLVGFAGKAYVGKDTSADYLRDFYGYSRYALAQPIKAALSAMGIPHEYLYNPALKETPIPGFEGLTGRHLAQTLGTEWGREQHEDFWLLCAKRKWGEINERGLFGLAISDIRFENEADWVRSEGGLIIHIDAIPRGDVSNRGHASEAGIERKQGDVIVQNIADLAFLYRQLDSALYAYHEDDE